MPYSTEKLGVSWNEEDSTYNLRRETEGCFTPCEGFADLVSSMLALYEARPTVLELDFIQECQERLGERQTQTLEAFVAFCNRVAKATHVLEGK